MAKKITEDGEIVDEVTYEPVARVAPFWKTPYNHDTSLEAIKTATFIHEPSKTQQQFARDADINVILAKFMQTGELPIGAQQPRYQDFEREFDLQEQMVTAHQVKEAWDALPVAVRNMLRDPRTFADYVTHCLETGDLEPLQELGLAIKPAGEPVKRPEEPQATRSPEGGTPAPPGGKAAPAA